MDFSPRRAVVFACYQVTLLVGITLLPVAVAARQVGIDLPLGRLVARLGRAYDRTRRTA